MSDFDAPLARMRAATDRIGPTELQLSRWQAAAALALARRPERRRFPFRMAGAAAAALCVLAIAGVVARRLATSLPAVSEDEVRFRLAKDLIRENRWLDARHELALLPPDYPGAQILRHDLEESLGRSVALDDKSDGNDARAPMDSVVAVRPDEAGVLRFIDGDLTGAMASEDVCSEPRCKRLASAMREFADAYKRIEDLDAHGLKKLLALDSEITGHRRSRMARTAGVKLGTGLCQSASAAKAAGQYARAGDLASQSLEADPGNSCSRAILRALKTYAHDLYMRAYMLKDQEPDQAVEKFMLVIQLTPPDSEDRLKAQNWIRVLEKR
jgi:tetratricopeptide (TPR) repeat protein